MMKLTSIVAKGVPIPDLNLYVPPRGTVTISDADYGRSRDVTLQLAKRTLTTEWVADPPPAPVRPVAAPAPEPAKAPPTERDLLGEALAQNRMLIEALLGRGVPPTSPVAGPAAPAVLPAAPAAGGAPEALDEPPEEPRVFIPSNLAAKEIQGTLRAERAQGAGVGDQVDALRRLKGGGA